MADDTKKSFNLRAFASVFAGLSFVLMVVTGLALFIAPSCRIASDTSWTVWGHDKDQWVAVHVWLSIAFIIASAIHIYLNWSVLISYFKSKIRKGWAFRAEWLAALAVCAVLYAGSARDVAPFSSLMAWKETFKHPAAGASGPGPQAHAGAELPGSKYEIPPSRPNLPPQASSRATSSSPKPQGKVRVEPAEGWDKRL